MKNKILIILPSRCGNADRAINVERFIENWKSNTEGLSDICVAIDDDEHQKYTRHEGVIYDINPNLKLAPKLNLVSSKYKNEYKYIAFFGDDHIIKTKWEKEFIDYLDSKTIAIAYGNDLFQSEKLPTAVCMTSNIIDTLGYMIPLNLTHMYVDNFWLDLGTELNIIKYFGNIIFEHIHPDAGKTHRDTQYQESNTFMTIDNHEYTIYINSIDKINDIKKLKKLQ